MSPDTLRRAGEALYGSAWQSELARALQVNDRRVRAWLAGERSIPAGVWPELVDLMRSHGVALSELADSVERQL